jgi:3-methyl-2-oxobutanoate hydroxymethyltransferase
MSQSSTAPLTVPQFQALKGSGRKLTMVTCYDYATARILDGTPVDGLLVGDTLGMVVQGHENTLSVTLDQMIYHGEMVRRGAPRPLVVVDLPFPSYHLGLERTIENAARVLQEARCPAVKLEGGEARAAIIAALVAADIPVMAHVGLLPQSVHKLGGFKMERDAARVVADAQAVEAAGAFAVVLECIPPDVAARVTEALSIPTIGIGAGPDCDGQVLVVNDLLGLTSGHLPRFVKQYADLRQTIGEAVSSFCAEVRAGKFPARPQPPATPRPAPVDARG